MKSIENAPINKWVICYNKNNNPPFYVGKIIEENTINLEKLYGRTCVTLGMKIKKWVFSDPENFLKNNLSPTHYAEMSK